MLRAILAGFIVGLLVGRSSRINERARVSIEEFVMNFFAPVFFAGIGRTLELPATFDLRLCILVLAPRDGPEARRVRRRGAGRRG